MYRYLLTFARWLLLGTLIGAIGGGIGALFAHSISYATDLRGGNGWLVWLLPLGGLISVGIYQLLRVYGAGTNQVLESVRSEKKVPVLLAPAIFLGTVISHLLGASAGREGAALQLGGGIASFVGRLLRLNQGDRHILTLCGMSAFFSALFGTPLGAFVFALEVVSVGTVNLAAVFPCVVAALAAFLVSGALGVVPERFDLPQLSGFELDTVWRVAIIAIVAAIVSMLFCRGLHYTERLFLKLFKNPYLRVAVGGTLILLLTLIFGTDYNGGGMEIVHGLFKGNSVGWEAFLLKLSFTCITVAAGFKGGEIVPSFFIGSTLGFTLAAVVGINPALGAAVGMIALFCGVTNCPLATLFLAVELFDGQGILYFALSVAIAFLLSGSASLYTAQHLSFSKLFERSSRE